MQTLTDNDHKLIGAAYKVSYTDWDRIFPMIQQADSNEAKQILHNILTERIHQEEAACGCI